MKNVTSFKVSIDRSRAPKKMGTLKGVSLFPTDGEYGGGIIAKSMELDESLEKPRTKCRRLHQENLAWPVLLGLLSPTNYLKLWKEIHRSPLHRSFTASDLSAMLQNDYFNPSSLPEKQSHNWDCSNYWTVWKGVWCALWAWQRISSIKNGNPLTWMQQDAIRTFCPL